MPPPVPPPPSSEALNGTILDSLDQWQPGASRFIHQQVRGDGRRKSPGALGLRELMWQRLGKPGKEWAQGEGREAGKRPALPTSCHVRGEGRSDQVLITCPRPEQGNSLVRLAVSSRLLGVTRAVPLPPPGEALSTVLPAASVPTAHARLQCQNVQCLHPPGRPRPSMPPRQRGRARLQVLPQPLPLPLLLGSPGGQPGPEAARAGDQAWPRPVGVPPQGSLGRRPHGSWPAHEAS